MDWSQLDMRIAGLLRHYRNNDFKPEELYVYLQERIAQFQQHNIWIYLLSDKQLSPYFARLKQFTAEQLPLYGVPFAIKDNIDLAGVPTTAACPEFAYTPGTSAFVVQRLIEAGAIPIGKTNLDQFATGLAGTRSPWGPCRNAFNADYISGGSSSGSAVALALGLVAFSLGTDTAGSGRVPAALNNVIGLKPTKGLLSTRGVVPACRSLDCVSVFALTVEDARQVFSVTAAFDEADCYSRKNRFSNSMRTAGIAPTSLRLGIPTRDQLAFFGNAECKQLWQLALQSWQALGAELVEIDFEPFRQAARLLYEGPWVAERYLATESIVRKNVAAMDPVVRSIIEGGRQARATDAFAAQYELQQLQRQADDQLATVDCLITPTVGTQYRIDQVLANPVSLNSNLGYYTNYMNLLDYSAVAVPAARAANGVPWGITLVGPAFGEQKLLALAARWQFERQEMAGRLKVGPYADQPTVVYREQSYIKVAVCGAHLQGQPLNWQLTERSASLERACRSSANYRLYALPDGKRPALVRDDQRGVAIEIEVWLMPAAEFGSFVAAIPAPLGIGKLETEDGEWLSGFICEQGGLEGASDISEFGGWRAYLKIS